MTSSKLRKKYSTKLRPNSFKWKIPLLVLSCIFPIHIGALVTSYVIYHCKSFPTYTDI